MKSQEARNEPVVGQRVNEPTTVQGQRVVVAISATTSSSITPTTTTTSPVLIQERVEALKKARVLPRPRPQLQLQPRAPSIVYANADEGDPDNESVCLAFVVLLMGFFCPPVWWAAFCLLHTKFGRRGLARTFHTVSTIFGVVSVVLGLAMIGVLLFHTVEKTGKAPFFHVFDR